ncbi:unnamed protein product [Phytophthora fragariaefolia]|uniref:Unnamed protein product n=1 Tax=Phytophthora fragariaefolia TaxID=1490495 RepID=A0A9W7CZD2_9STRA|nr:unnamed protein product [Phytophthora fragariaefolia]
MKKMPTEAKAAVVGNGTGSGLCCGDLTTNCSPRVLVFRCGTISLAKLSTYSSASKLCGCLSAPNSGPRHENPRLIVDFACLRAHGSPANLHKFSFFAFFSAYWPFRVISLHLPTVYKQANSSPLCLTHPGAVPPSLAYKSERSCGRRIYGMGSESVCDDPSDGCGSGDTSSRASGGVPCSSVGDSDAIRGGASTGTSGPSTSACGSVSGGDSRNERSGCGCSASGGETLAQIPNLSCIEHLDGKLTTPPTPPKTHGFAVTSKPLAGDLRELRFIAGQSKYVERRLGEVEEEEDVFVPFTTDGNPIDLRNNFQKAATHSVRDSIGRVSVSNQARNSVSANQSIQHSRKRLRVESSSSAASLKSQKILSKTLLTASFSTVSRRHRRIEPRRSSAFAH